MENDNVLEINLKYNLDKSSENNALKGEKHLQKIKEINLKHENNLKIFHQKKQMRANELNQKFSHAKKIKFLKFDNDEKNRQFKTNLEHIKYENKEKLQTKKNEEKKKELASKWERQDLIKKERENKKAQLNRLKQLKKLTTVAKWAGFGSITAGIYTSIKNVDKTIKSYYDRGKMAHLGIGAEIKSLKSFYGIDRVLSASQMQTQYTNQLKKGQIDQDLFHTIGLSGSSLPQKIFDGLMSSKHQSQLEIEQFHKELYLYVRSLDENRKKIILSNKLLNNAYQSGEVIYKTVLAEDYTPQQLANRSTRRQYNLKNDNMYSKISEEEQLKIDKKDALWDRGISKISRRFKDIRDDFFSIFTTEKKDIERINLMNKHSEFMKKYNMNRYDTENHVVQHPKNNENKAKNKTQDVNINVKSENHVVIDQKITKKDFVKKMTVVAQKDAEKIWDKHFEPVEMVI